MKNIYNIRESTKFLFPNYPSRNYENCIQLIEYKSDSYQFQALGYDIEVRDAEIAREMNLVRSTIHEHRKRSLEQMKK